MSVVLVMSCLAGCAPAREHAEICTGWQPIRPAAADTEAISGDLARQIIAHNRFGQNICRWVP